MLTIRRMIACAALLALSMFAAGSPARPPTDQGRLQHGADRRRRRRTASRSSAIEIWRDDVNAKGGLLGRPVELIYYDDQSNPANVPGIYTKLITVDKVDLLLGPYGTNLVAPAMPVIMQNKMMTDQHSRRSASTGSFTTTSYFSMVPVGPEA